MARAEAEALVTGARARTKTMLHDARTAAQALQKESRDKATSLEQDVTRQRTAILDALHHDKSLLENHIDKLRAFELEYRTQLAAYLQSQLDQLDGPARAAPANPIPTQQDLVSFGPGARGDSDHAPPSSR
jgi:hypothetical protein